MQAWTVNVCVLILDIRGKFELKTAKNNYTQS